jgi:hypothetical protein
MSRIGSEAELTRGIGGSGVIGVCCAIDTTDSGAGTVNVFPHTLHLAVRPAKVSGTLNVLPHFSQVKEIMLKS